MAGPAAAGGGVAEALAGGGAVKPRAQSKQSVVLERVEALSGSVARFRQLAAVVGVLLAIVIVGNFGTSIAALLYLKDVYVAPETGVSETPDGLAVSTGATLELYDAQEPFFDHEDLVDRVAAGMAVVAADEQGRVTVRRVDSAVVEADGSVLLLSAGGEELGAAAVLAQDDVGGQEEESTGRRLRGFPAGSRSLVTRSTGTKKKKCPENQYYNHRLKKCYPRLVVRDPSPLNPGGGQHNGRL